MHKEDLDIILSDPDHFLQEVQESAQREMRQQQLQVWVQKAATPADVDELMQRARQACQTAALGHWPEQEPVLYLAHYWGKSDLQALHASMLDLRKAAAAWQDAAGYVNAAHQAAHKLGLRPSLNTLSPPSERLPNAAAQAQRLDIQAQVTQGLWKLKVLLQEWNPFRAATRPKALDFIASELRKALAQCHPHASYLRDHPIEGFNVALGSIEPLMEKDHLYQPLGVYPAFDPYTNLSQEPPRPQEWESVKALAKRNAEWVSVKQYCIEERQKQIEARRASRNELIHVARQLQQALSGTQPGAADPSAPQTGMPLPSAPAEIHDITRQLQSIHLHGASASAKPTDLPTMQSPRLEIDVPSTPQDTRCSYKDSLASIPAAVSRYRPASRPVVFSASRSAQGPSVPATQTNRADARPTSRTTGLRTEKAARRPLRPATASALIKAKPTQRAPDLRRHALLNTRFIPPAIQAESAPAERRATDAQIKQAMESVAHFDKASRLELDATMNPLLDRAKTLTVQAHAHSAITAEGPAWQHHAHQLAAWRLVVQAHDTCANTLTQQSVRLFEHPAREPAVIGLRKNLQADLQVALEQMRIAAKGACETLFEACHQAEIRKAAGTDRPGDYQNLAQGCRDVLTPLQSCAQRKEPAPTNGYIPCCEALESMCIARQREPQSGAQAFEMATCLKRVVDQAAKLATEAQEPISKRLKEAHQSWSKERGEAMKLGTRLQTDELNAFARSVKTLQIQAFARATELCSELPYLINGGPLAEPSEAVQNNETTPTSITIVASDQNLVIYMNAIAQQASARLLSTVIPPADAPNELHIKAQFRQTNLRIHEVYSSLVAEMINCAHQSRQDLATNDVLKCAQLSRRFAESLELLNAKSLKVIDEFNTHAAQLVQDDDFQVALNFAITLQNGAEHIEIMTSTFYILSKIFKARDHASKKINEMTPDFNSLINTQEEIIKKYNAIEKNLRALDLKPMEEDEAKSQQYHQIAHLRHRTQYDKSLINSKIYLKFIKEIVKNSSPRVLPIIFEMREDFLRQLETTIDNIKQLKHSVTGAVDRTALQPIVIAKLAMTTIGTELQELDRRSKLQPSRDVIRSDAKPSRPARKAHSHKR